ncbi:sh3 domain-containing protein [Lichtheimia corymbifera JMRC:FSU:9682]|uniref:Sh3 domain-containing protein n=2 Tax=Lichtheimia corymbifera JMRC:FSU:9682 TaxID=1263082 RepID=A0A068S267_9FUNG|nr:sh3 domain-containing protein [Lichtheimia corymbifera JMRC:FSU:9682]
MSFQINSPLPSSLASECRKASRILNSFINPGQGLDTIIPPGILANAKGLAIYSVLKAGFLFSGRAGSGLVIARLPDGSWSAPSAIATGGMGFGGQVGAELTDFVMVLNTTAAVKTFMHHGSITLGGNISVAAGPIGRNAEASGTASIKSVAAVYSYSKTRGLFAGVSLEGSVILERFDANAKMYGRKVATRDLLNGTIPPPPQADPLYRALEVRFHGAGGNTYASSAAGGRFAFMNGSNDSGFGSGRGLGRSGTMYNTEPVYEDSFRGGNNDRSDYSRGGVHRAATTGGYGGGYSANRGLGDTYGSSNRSFDDSPSSFRDTTWENRNSNEIRARALFNFSKQQDGDLPFRKGDIITIIKRTDTQHDWWTGRLNSETGIFPANFVEII